jgi:hypothetical protein
MTVLYNSNFEGLTTNVVAPQFNDPTLAFRVYTYAATSTTAIQGTQAFFSNANQSWAVNTTIGAITNQAVRHAHRVASLTSGAFASQGAILCAASSTDGNTDSYRIRLETNNTGLRMVIGKYQGGTTIIATSASYAFTPAPSDVIHSEFKRVGTTIEARAWLNSDARPATADNSVSAAYATAVVTDSTLTSGMAGPYFTGAGTYVPVDNLVITDAAGGEDYYYAPSTTIACTVGAAAAAGATASIQKSTVIAGSIGNAIAAGSAATITNGTPSTTVACVVGNAAAAGLSAAFGTFVQSDQLINNTGTLLPATAVYWTWTPAGRIGSMVGITPVDGTGTTDANARLSPGIARAAGKLDISVRAAAAVDDAVYCEMFA